MKQLKISLTNQSLTAIEIGNLGNKANEIFAFSCVTGDAVHPTPKGRFNILRKERVRRSRKYNAQMNYALQLTLSGIFIHESYNIVDQPIKQTPIATILSDTSTYVISKARVWLPIFSSISVNIKNVNLFGSHGCIRLSHSDAVLLFDWVEIGTPVEITF